MEANPLSNFDVNSLVSSAGGYTLAFWFAKELLRRFDKTLDTVVAGFKLAADNALAVALTVKADIDLKHLEVMGELRSLKQTGKV